MSHFIMKAEQALMNKQHNGKFTDDFDMYSYQRSLEEEEKSKKLVQKANRLKNNVSGGFVNRRKTQILGFKLLQVLQMEGDDFITKSDSKGNRSSYR